MCATITAARSGLNTVLVQDRPILGGNAGKEIRVTPVGADSCNFLYSRETGLIEEIMLKNLHDNPDFSYEGFDIVLKSFIKAEPGLTCFFNTSIVEIEIDSSIYQLKSVKGYTSGSETWQIFNAPFFADCTADGTIGALAGAPLRIGIEAKREFNEWMCEEFEQTICMGGSVQFRSIGTGNYSLRPEDPIRPDPSSKWHTGKAALYAQGEFQNEAFCFQLQPSQPVYRPENVVNQYSRPTNQPNMWASESTDFAEPEWIELSWDTHYSPKQIDVIFDSMLDFHVSQRWGGYRKNILPSIVEHYRSWAYDSQGYKTLIVELKKNDQRLCKHKCELKDVKSIRLEILAANGLNRAYVFAIRIFQ